MKKYKKIILAATYNKVLQLLYNMFEAKEIEGETDMFYEEIYSDLHSVRSKIKKYLEN